MDAVTPVDASLVSVRTAADFAECLDQLRVLAGPLSHREIAARSGGRLRRTKIGQVLAGELPRREVLLAYLEVCGVSEVDPWCRVWTRLVSASHGMSRISDDNPQLLKRERDAARAQVRQLSHQLEMVKATARTGDESHAAALQQARLEVDQYRSDANRCRSAENERDQAQGRIRLLSNELIAGRSRIAELTEQVKDLRATLTTAHAQLASGPKEALARTAPGDAKLLTRYTQHEAEELYGSDETTPPPVIGE